MWKFRIAPDPDEVLEWGPLAGVALLRFLINRDVLYDNLFFIVCCQILMRAEFFSQSKAWT